MEIGAKSVIENNLIILLVHLLKWKYQVDRQVIAGATLSRTSAIQRTDICQTVPAYSLIWKCCSAANEPDDSAETSSKLTHQLHRFT